MIAPGDIQSSQIKGQWVIDLLRDGFVILPVEDIESYEYCEKFIWDSFGARLNVRAGDLTNSNLSQYLFADRVNDLRMAIFEDINKDDVWFDNFFNCCASAVVESCGTELARNSKINFSIQLPKDSSSLLPPHADTFSGESPYQMNVLLPFGGAFQSNSMVIFDKDSSRSINKLAASGEIVPFNELFERYKSKYRFLDIPDQHFILFSPTYIHGNVLNSTSFTRISVNCRFKNLHSPVGEVNPSKTVGDFYRIQNLVPATAFGQAYEEWTGG